MPCCFLCFCIFRHPRVLSVPYKGAWQKEPFLWFTSAAKCYTANCSISPLWRLCICTYIFYLRTTGGRKATCCLHMKQSHEKNNSRPGLFSLFRQHLMKLWPWLKLQGWVNHICDYRFLKGTCFYWIFKRYETNRYGIYHWKHCKRTLMLLPQYSTLISRHCWYSA